jgi:uncharacterized protein YecT (DUF1311 family)
VKALLALLCLALPAAALAQYSGPAIDACRSYAKRELTRDGARIKDVAFDADRDLLLERYARKIGSQRVHSILSGNGAIVYQTTPSIELSFVCLLATEKKPVFFFWVPRRHRSALAQCTRSEALRAGPRRCLESLLQLEERELTQRYAERLQEARERAAAQGHQQAYQAYERSNKAWLEYRNAECARRSVNAGADQDPNDVRLACLIELSRLRAAEMRR